MDPSVRVKEVASALSSIAKVVEALLENNRLI
jgi:hypothetical protein